MIDKNFEPTELYGVYKLKLNQFFDDRGKIINLFENNQTFNLEKLTISKKNVLRGLHSDSINDKLIYCLRGKFKLVIVNYDNSSKDYLKKIEFIMTEKSNYAVFVPKNFLNGHYCLKNNTYFYYKWSHGYVPPEQQISVNWNSPTLNIDWGLIEKQPLLSDRDKQSKTI